MKYPDNIAALAALPVDMLGFIFYPPSPRCLHLAPQELPPLPPAIRKVGVFVDSDTPCILRTVAQYGLDAVQLHGQESPGQCAGLRNHATVIKAFHVAAEGDFGQCAPYAGTCDYFLFEACTPLHGGAGTPFDWNILPAYRDDTPLSANSGIRNFTASTSTAALKPRPDERTPACCNNLLETFRTWTFRY